MIQIYNRKTNKYGGFPRAVGAYQGGYAAFRDS